jgi:hypothetical protein
MVLPFRFRKDHTFMQADKETITEDYAGQQDGVNVGGCPIIEGQNVTNAVNDLDALLAHMGFRSVEEMIAAAAQL